MSILHDSAISIAPGSVVIVRDEEWLVTGVEHTTDGRLLRCQGLSELVRDTAQMSFAWIENNAELRRAIEGGDLGAWRVFLHSEQRKYAERSYSGPFRLSGGAGAGKTVVLLHRTRYAYLATWDIGTLFDELAGDQVSLPSVRRDWQVTSATFQQPGGG